MSVAGMSLSKLQQLAASFAEQATNPKAWKSWIRWRGGLMDTYITPASEKSREEAQRDGESQWAYRFPSPA